MKFNNRMKILYGVVVGFGMLFSFGSHAQTYVGAGQAELVTFKTRFEKGVVFMVQRDFQIKESKWRFTPIAQVGLYYGEVGSYMAPNYSTTASLSAPFSYRLIAGKRVSFDLFAGPYVARLQAFGIDYFLEYQARKEMIDINEALGVTLDWSYTHDINYTLVNLTWGCSMDIKVSDKLAFKLVPFSIQMKKLEQKEAVSSPYTRRLMSSLFSVLIQL